MTLSKRSSRSRFLPSLLLASLLTHASFAQSGPAPTAAQRPLSPAQTALFDTPHLANVSTPETLLYDYRRTGAEQFTDKIALHVKQIYADGSKDVTVDYLAGERRVPFPALDHFHGNPVFMFVLEHDVGEMNKALGISKAYFRNRVRDAFIDAPVANTAVTIDGKSEPARVVTFKPFEHDARFGRIPSMRAKTYRFVLADSVPGMIAEVDVDTPPDPALQAPGLSDKITFAGVEK